MKTYPDEKPSLFETTIRIMCSLLASGHYTYPHDEDEGEPPGYFVIYNGKNWNREEEGTPVFTGRYSTRALSHAMEIAAEVEREMDLEEEFKKDSEKPIA